MGSGMVAGSKTRTGHKFRRQGVPTVSYFEVKSRTQHDVSYFGNISTLSRSNRDVFS